jgi:hypothetical protein
MSNADIARFRAQADECRQRPNGQSTRSIKESWLRLAGEWTKMAQAAELTLQPERGRLS